MTADRAVLALLVVAVLMLAYVLNDVRKRVLFPSSSSTTPPGIGTPGPFDGIVPLPDPMPVGAPS